MAYGAIPVAKTMYYSYSMCSYCTMTFSPMYPDKIDVISSI